MTADQIIREEFERWYMDRGYTTQEMRRSNVTLTEYHLCATQSTWEAWHAAWAIATSYVA